VFGIVWGDKAEPPVFSIFPAALLQPVVAVALQKQQNCDACHGRLAAGSGKLRPSTRGGTVMKKFFLVLALGFVFATGFGLTVVSLTQPAMAASTILIPHQPQPAFYCGGTNC